MCERWRKLQTAGKKGTLAAAVHGLRSKVFLGLKLPPSTGRDSHDCLRNSFVRCQTAMELTRLEVGSMQSLGLPPMAAHQSAMGIFTKK